MPLCVQVAPLSLVLTKNDRSIWLPSLRWPWSSSLNGTIIVPSDRYIGRLRGSHPKVSWKNGLSSVQVTPLSKEVRKRRLHADQPVPRSMGWLPSILPQISQTRSSRVVNRTALPGDIPGLRIRISGLDHTFVPCFRREKNSTWSSEDS